MGVRIQTRRSENVIKNTNETLFKAFRFKIAQDEDFQLLSLLTIIGHVVLDFQ